MIGTIRVLLVEDNPADARWVREMLREDPRQEFSVLHATTVAAAVDKLSGAVDIDAVLLDLTLPDETGMNTLRRILASTQTAVIVVMTGHGDEQVGLTAMQTGAQDYLVKGQVDGRTLRRALRFALERQTVLQRLSHRDDLTGLHNRRGFLIQADQLTRSALRHEASLLLLFLDLDQLKVINDTFGHAEGNRALLEAADVLRRCFRQSDLLARFGGDEFAALAMTGGDADETLIRARLQGALDAVNVQPDRDYPLAFSVGLLTCAPAEATPIESMLERADQLMYREKRRKAEAFGSAAPAVTMQG
jgi:two-component system cell cycle response regulator